MRGQSIRYSAEELAWLEENREFTRRELHRLFVMFFGRDDVTLDNIKALCTRKRWNTGRTGCFEKGAVPANKGRKCEPGKGGRHPNARRTQFKKGHRGGTALERYKPIGFERLSKEGYRERKIHDGLPMQSRWRAVHLIEWEALHGPVPEGHCLKCLDGDRANADPSNWECVPRSMLPRLAGRWKQPYDSAPDELKPAILATARLEHRARIARKAVDA